MPTSTTRSSRSDTPAQRLQRKGWDVSDSGCWEWKGNRMKAGYGYLKISYANRLAHRVAYEAWVAPITDSKQVLHSCDNPPCINPQHLRLGLDADNAADRVARDRIAHGSGHWRSKISEADVIDIRSEYAKGILTQKMLGDVYGLSQTMIGNIVRSDNWSRV